MNSDALAHALLEAVRAQEFGATPDAMQSGRAVSEFPSVDLAVIAFPDRAAPVFANVLFSREHPHGIVAAFAGVAGAVANVRFLADQRDAQGTSIAWQPGADWSRMKWLTLGRQAARAGAAPAAASTAASTAASAGVDASRAGAAPGASVNPNPSFVAPYPASLLKLMVLVGIGLGVDSLAIDWAEPWPYGRQEVAVADWCEDMIVTSSNDATSAMVSLLHARGLLGTARNALHDTFGALGLHTLRVAGTQPDGGWSNGAGAGVGQIQMTAWDTARLLWLLDDAAASDARLAPPWPEAKPFLSSGTRERILGWLRGQGLHEILSSTLLAGVPGWQRGIPAQLPARWIDAQGGATVGGERYPPDVRPASGAAEVSFAHKTGTTENYAADAGIVRGLAPHRRHYIVALLTNLGSRYKACEACATTWKIPALGAAIDAAMRRELELPAR